jgi:hypothetical protein
MDFRTSGRMLVIRQNKRSPTDADWEAFLAEMVRLRPKLTEMRALIFTDGGGLTSEQRKKLSVAMGGAEIQTALISDRAMTRFIVATVGLFNKTIRSFLTSETPAAFAWLGLQREDRKTVKELLSSLEKTVSDLSGSVETAVSSSG